MKKLITLLMCSVVGGTAFAQWSPSIQKRSSQNEISLEQNYYKLDINQIRGQLRGAQEMGPNAKPIEISLPTLRGKIEKFAVYSFPVMSKDLADQYQLGSYVGVGIDDPSKYLRFSLAPNDFQSMVINKGQYEFIEPTKGDKTVYWVHPKSNKNENGFVCSTEEGPTAKQQIDQMLKAGQSFTNQPTNFSKNSDKKYRTLRLVMSTTGEYTQFFGGVAGALAQVNATITRVNGVFEKDFGVHLNLLSYPGLIYADPATDPYDAVTNAAQPPSTWNTSLRDVLATNVGQANYDIGHLFGASGGGGNAGCIGCVCMSPIGTGYDSVVGYGKGSGITSPATGSVNPTAANPPSGDNFDIDYVAHEMGHQLGANHTFAHTMQGSPVQMEPGSGSTIMGYAGITGATTDVQPHSDPYFFKGSIDQVQTNLIAKTCDVETSTTNNPPVIADLPTYNIPKGTAFVLTAAVTDPENDPMTYTWEEVDNTSVVINKTNLGTTTSGATFRSVNPGTSPTRYFPKLESVINGYLDNSNNTWEAVSQVARTTNFAITARDNNTFGNQQQTSSKTQQIIVGNDGPFRVSNTSAYLYSNVSNTLTWDVANTATGVYNSPNVKIDYSVDNGVNWTTLLASTANDGSETISVPASLNGQFVAVRISSIGNVFYAIKKMMVTTQAACGAAVTGVNVTAITSGAATVNWAPVTGATSYLIQYKKTTDASWQQTTSTTTNVNLSGLIANSAYQVQVASVCGTQGPFSASVTFTTAAVTYCTLSATNSPQFEYISNVKITNNVTNAVVLNNSSGPSTYTDYTISTALQPNLVLNTSYAFSMTITDADYDTALVFIDYNNNGTFESTERVYNYPVALPTGPISGNFTVPATAVANQPLRMRVVLYYAGAANAGLSLGSTFAGCGTYGYGEVEDYNVLITSTPLATSDVAGPKNDIQVYPNPVSDILNITKVSDKSTYKIYSAVGQLVKQGNISNGQINVSELIKGGYVITIEDKGREPFTSKFIKK
ncbi:zinc-dependent metalloprotease family protein [Chryseobacterium ginsenosidimutans]|uniref:reprolysin-like metallopeptidase n=1 Tax=Chryseobacterium ginsenosidimutans TaxID=687846 RepID=UPI0031E121E6